MKENSFWKKLLDLEWVAGTVDDNKEIGKFLQISCDFLYQSAVNKSSSCAKRFAHTKTSNTPKTTDNAITCSTESCVNKHQTS